MPKVNTPWDCLGILLLGRVGQGKSTTGNKLLKAGGELVLREDKIKEFETRGGRERCTHEIRSVFRRETKEMKAVEVVDTPGFADINRDESERLSQAMLCDLIRKLINDRLEIHRVLYFLPCRGAPERVSPAIQAEIHVMHHFFGSAIFDRMVLVATHVKRFQHCRLSEEDIKDTKVIFEKTIKFTSIRDYRLKCPPVIFIGLDDAGVNIQRRIESAPAMSNTALTLDKSVMGPCPKYPARYQ